MRKTQNMKVLAKWIRRQAQEPQRFFFGYEFIGELGSPEFVGYKAPTRFCELCVEHPSFIDSHDDGKYRVGRIRFENAEEFLQRLPADLALFVWREMKDANVPLDGVTYSPVKPTIRV